MELKPVLEKIDFVNRYQKISEEHNDFDNRMRSSKKMFQDSVMKNMGYDYKYISNGSFFQIKETIDKVLFQLHFVLKRGVVEMLLFIKVNDENIQPQGRIDFFPEELGIPFERLKYGLPKYSSLEDLEEILKSLFSIYEDLKVALVEHLEAGSSSWQN